MKITESNYTVELNREELGTIVYVLTEVSKDKKKYRAVLDGDDADFHNKLNEIVDTISEAYHK